MSGISRSVFLLVVLISVFYVSQASGQSCDPDFVSLDPNVLRVNVLPTGSDDTGNIQCALDVAAAEGIPIVKLERATYFVSSVSVAGFDGSFEGTTRRDSVVRIIGG